MKKGRSIGWAVLVQAALDLSTACIRTTQPLDLPFLGQFRIFENCPLDPVFCFLSKCEKKSKFAKQKFENFSREIQNHHKFWLSLAQLGSAWLSLAQLGSAWLSLAQLGSACPRLSLPSAQLALGSACPWLSLPSAQLGPAWLSSAWLSSVHLGSFQLGSASPGLAQLGSAWLSLAQLGSAWLSSAQLGSTSLSSTQHKIIMKM